VLARVAGGKPFEPFGKDSDQLKKAETRDDGPTGPATSKSPLRWNCWDRPFSSRPEPTDGRLYTDFERAGKEKPRDREARGLRETVRPLDTSGESGVFRPKSAVRSAKSTGLVSIMDLTYW